MGCASCWRSGSRRGRLFHLVSVVAAGASGAPSPPWRHALFVAVNVFFGWAMLRPPRWLVVPAAVLVAQQGYGHGADLRGTRRRAGQVDVQSAVTLLDAAVRRLGGVESDARGVVQSGSFRQNVPCRPKLLPAGVQLANGIARGTRRALDSWS